MLKARHFTAAAKPKGTYALPPEFDGRVHQAVLYDVVKAYQGNQRHGTHSTKTRAEVSGGSRKPWRQKGTGRARAGTTRAPHWTGGGVVFGPHPRSYVTKLPRKVKRLARLSAFNARAKEDAIIVIESLAFDGPKTRRMVELLEGLGLGDRKVLVLTAELRSDVYLSGRNLSTVRVQRYADAAPYDILWSDAVVIEEAAIGRQSVGGSARRAAPVRGERVKQGGDKQSRSGRAVSRKRTRSGPKTAKAAGGKRKTTKRKKTG